MKKEYYSCEQCGKNGCIEVLTNEDDEIYLFCYYCSHIIEVKRIDPIDEFFKR